jgi:O-antigen ligase
MSRSVAKKLFRPNGSKILIADTLLVYSMLAPIILNVIGSYVDLKENFIRTFLVLYGSVLVSLGLYVKTFGRRIFDRNRVIVFIVSGLALIVTIAGLKNPELSYPTESLKFFFAFCISGFFLGMTASTTIARARILNYIWMPWMVISLLFSLFLFQHWGCCGYNFTLPGNNPARIASLFLLFGFIGLTNLSSTNKMVTKIFYGVLFFLFLSIAFLTNSRSILTSFGIILILYIILRFKFSQTRHDRFNLIALISLLLIFACLIGWGMKKNYFSSRILNILQIPSQTIAYIVNDDQEIDTDFVRLPIWRDAILKFSKSPFWGAGLGAERYNKVYVHPHNILLQFLAETGLIGSAAFVFFVLAVTKGALNNYRALKSKNDRRIYLLYPISFAFFLLGSFFHFAIHENYFLWYFAGLITGFDPSTRSECTSCRQA